MKRNLWLVLIQTFVCVIFLSACNTTDTPQNDTHIHTFGEWETASEATCTDNGSKVRVCECGEKETETISALGHNYKSVTIDPTASSDGYTEHTCSVCDNIYKDSYIRPIEFTITKDNRELIGYKGTDEEKLVIPDVFQNAGKWYKVTTIGDYAFDGCSNLRGVTISDTVTSIGIRAFSACTNIRNIVIPDSVTKISVGAFAFCENLRTATIGNGVKTIEDFLFVDCYSLTTANIPHDIKSIGENAFINCTFLEKIKFNGTIDEWDAITKATNWAPYYKYYVIECIDGTI